MKRFSSFISAALSVLLLVVSVSPASAATTSKTSTVSSPDSSAGLSIEPRKNYTISPGQTVTDKLTIGNLDNTSGLSLSLRMIDFTYTNQSGTPKLFLAQNAPQTPWSLKPYTTLPSSLTLAPGASTTINYSITIPKNLGAGSYYSAILYQTGQGNGGNVGLGASGVTLVFVTVPGIVKENLQLQKFGAYTSTDSGVTGSYTYIATQNFPQMIAYTLKNSGNVTESPAGSITLKNIFGKEVGSIYQTNLIQSLALIGQSRLFATCIETEASQIQKLGGQTVDNTGQNQCVNPKMMPGLYTAHLDIYYGQNGNQTHEITSTARFWYLPWWFIIIVLIVLAAIIFGIWKLKQKFDSLVKGRTYHAGRGVSRKH